jgi:hypothetical protein
MNDPHRALDIDLDGPMDAMDLVLPTATHHIASGLTGETEDWRLRLG